MRLFEVIILDGKYSEGCSFWDFLTTMKFLLLILLEECCYFQNFMVNNVAASRYLKSKLMGSKKLFFWHFNSVWAKRVTITCIPCLAVVTIRSTKLWCVK